MNALTKAVDEIKFRIPYEVLREAFKDQNNQWKRAPVSLDESIISKLIRPKVIVDCNLVGGETVLISLEGLQASFADGYTTVYEIPGDRVQYRSIISVLSVGYAPFASFNNSGGTGYGTMVSQSANDVSMAAQRIGDAMSSSPPVSNAQAELVSHNTIAVRDQYRVTASYQIRCVLANDDNLNNISPRSYMAFCKLCELAVKAYIYNTLVIRIGQAFLQGGQSLDEFKSVVESYSDAGQMYQDYLRDSWQSIAFMNSQVNYTRLLKLQISPGL